MLFRQINVYENITPVGAIGAVSSSTSASSPLQPATKQALDQAKLALDKLSPQEREKALAAVSAVDESDPSGLLHAARHYNKEFIVTAETAEGQRKKFRVRAQSERTAREKFTQHYSQAKIISVTEIGLDEIVSPDPATDLAVGDRFEYGYFGKPKGQGIVVALIGPAGQESVQAKLDDGRVVKMPYRITPKNGYYIKKTEESSINEAVDASWVNAYRAMEANGGEPTPNKPLFFHKQMAMIAKSSNAINPTSQRLTLEFTNLIKQYNPKATLSDFESIGKLAQIAPSMEEVENYGQQRQTQATQFQQQQASNQLQHDLSMQQLIRQNNLDQADADAVLAMDVEARQAIMARKQELELEAQERLAKIEMDIRASKEPEEERRQALEMARLQNTHELAVIKATAEGEYKKAKLEADYQTRIKELENIDNQRERQSRLDNINAEKMRQLELINAETNAKIKELGANVDAEQQQSDIRIREEYMQSFKPIWASVIERASEVGRTLTQNISSINNALRRLSKPQMPSPAKENQQDVTEGNFRNRERNVGVEHETNNYAVYINGRLWKVFADQLQANNIARSLKSKGKDAKVQLTGLSPTSEDAAGVGIITKQNTTQDVKPGQERIEMRKLGLAEMTQAMDNLNAVHAAIRSGQSVIIDLDDDLPYEVNSKLARGIVESLSTMTKQQIVTNIRSHEFLESVNAGIILESVSTMPDSAREAIPNAFVIPKLHNTDPYIQYRYGVALATAKGQKHRQQEGSMNNVGKESEWGESLAVVDYTGDQGPSIDAALSMVGLSARDKKVITTPGSRETKDTHSQSPVAQRRDIKDLYK